MKAAVFAATALLSLATAESLHVGYVDFHDYNALEVRGEVDAACACPTHTVTVYEEATSAPNAVETIAPFTTITTSRITAIPSSPASIESYSEVSSSTPATAATSESASVVSSSNSYPSEAGLPAAAPSYASPSSLSTSLSSAVPATSSSSSSPSTAHHTNGNKWAITYTPYDASGNCKTAAAVAADIATIASKGFTTIRLYAPDCSGLQTVGAAAASHDLRLILGIYIDEHGVAGARPQIEELVAWSSSSSSQANGAGGSAWERVEMVVVGNEAVFQGFVSAEELAAFIGEVRAALGKESVGYKGPIATTETLETLQANKEVLCPVQDVVAANLHPFFNADVDAAGAGDFVASQLRQLAAVCSGEKEYYNLETGWPSKGSGSNGAAVPGEDEQKTAVQSISEKAGDRSCLFSFENDSWKEPGEFGVEQYWGCSNWF
ncbi:MAG: hypothetical protein Q9165_003871 [Trypethelium subeluteriae]